MKIDDKLINSWSKDKWLEDKRKLSDCVWCEGALMKHPEDRKIFLAPEPTEYGLVYEINLEDIVEVIATNRSKEKLDRSYIISRIYLKKDAVIVRQEWMLASELPEDIRPFNDGAQSQSQLAASESLLDISTKRSISSHLDEPYLSRPLPSPSPSPSPSPKPPPQRPVSGIRG